MILIKQFINLRHFSFHTSTITTHLMSFYSFYNKSVVYTNQTIFYISPHISTTKRNMLCKFLIIAVFVKSSCKHSLFVATRVKKGHPHQYPSNTSTGMSLNFCFLFNLPSPTILTFSKPLPDCFFLCDLCCIIRIHVSTMIITVILRTGCRFPHHHTARTACTCVI